MRDKCEGSEKEGDLLLSFNGYEKTDLQYSVHDLKLKLYFKHTDYMTSTVIEQLHDLITSCQLRKVESEVKTLRVLG